MDEDTHEQRGDIEQQKAARSQEPRDRGAPEVGRGGSGAPMGDQAAGPTDDALADRDAG
jgi:hypothetical protein